MSSDITEMLTIGAWLKGYRLVWEEQVVDPVYLYNEQGQIVHEWHYIPSLGEVDEACKTLMGAKN